MNVLGVRKKDRLFQLKDELLENLLERFELYRPRNLLFLDIDIVKYGRRGWNDGD